MTTALDVRVTNNYTRRLAALRERAGIVLATAWTRLPAYDEANVEQFIETTNPAITAGRTAVATLTAGYLNHFTGSRRLVTLEELDELDPDLLRQPFLTAWGAIKRGDEYSTAIDLGASRAAGTGGEVVTITARNAASVIDRSEPSITGWSRVPSGNCCRFCADKAAVDWFTAETASQINHDNCHCSIVPITRSSAPGRDINAPRLQGLAANPDAPYLAADGAPVDAA